MKLLHVFLLLSYQPVNGKPSKAKPKKQVQKIKKNQNEKIKNKNAEHFDVFQTENSLVAEKRKNLLKVSISLYFQLFMHFSELG